MGLCNSPDIFQERIGNLMADLEYVCTYIDDCLIITKGKWHDRLQKLDEVLRHLQDAGLNVNATKSFLGCPEVEYLGYWVTRDGLQPLPKKVDAIQAIAPPKTKKELRWFIGMCNFYRECVMHWRLILEEYGPELVYTPGHTNIVADALSHLEIAAIQPTLDLNLTFSALQLANAELLGHDTTDVLANIYPLSYKLLASLQAQDKVLQQANLCPNSPYTLYTFCDILWGRKVLLSYHIQ
jgi:hypothetical protein